MKLILWTVLMALGVAVIVFLPWVLFWCIETLFGHAIPFTLRNWLAGLILIGMASGAGASRS